MKKKRILIILLVLIFIIVLGYGYMVNKNKVSQSVAGTTGENVSVICFSNDGLNKKILLNIKAGLIPADLSDLSESINIDGTSLESFKANSTGYVSLDSSEKCKIVIKDDNFDIVKEVYVDPNKDFSTWIVLDKGKSYKAYLDSDKYMGLYFVSTCEYSLY